MKKYIRTKDGIYDMTTKNEKGEYDVQIVDYVEEETYGGRTGRLYLIPPKSVIKQADNVEELCDEFIIKMSKEHYVSKRSLLELRDMNNYVGCIYGAIWTDKGLIYVAKMNEKGKLVLL